MVAALCCDHNTSWATFEILLLQLYCKKKKWNAIVVVWLWYSSHFYFTKKRRHDGWRNSSSHLFNSDKTTNSTQIWYHLWNLNPGQSLVGFPIPNSRIPHSTSKIFPDFGFHKQRFPAVWNLDSLTWHDSALCPCCSPLLKVHETGYRYSTYAPFLLKQHQPKQLHLFHQLSFEMLYLSELVPKTLHGE